MKSRHASFEDLSINEENPEAYNRIKEYHTLTNPIHLFTDAGTYRGKEISKIKCSQYVKAIDGAKQSIQTKSLKKKGIEIERSKISLHSQQLKEELISIKKLEVQYADKLKRLKKLELTTHKKSNEYRNKIQQYKNIVKELNTQNEETLSKLKEQYAAVAISINNHLSNITELRGRYSLIYKELQNESTEYDLLNLSQLKVIDELKLVLLKFKEEEHFKLKVVRSKSRCLNSFRMKNELSMHSDHIYSSTKKKTTKL